MNQILLNDKNVLSESSVAVNHFTKNTGCITTISAVQFVNQRLRSHILYSRAANVQTIQKTGPFFINLEWKLQQEHVMINGNRTT